MQHAAGDLRVGGAARREPQPAGESAAARGESTGVGEQQRGPGEMWHHPPVSGQDRAGAQRGTGTQGKPGLRFIIGGKIVWSSIFVFLTVV